MRRLVVGIEVMGWGRWEGGGGASRAGRVVSSQCGRTVSRSANLR